jgi:hypothetical protein
MMNLEDACAAAWEMARERCNGCAMEAKIANGEIHYVGSPLAHTCYGDIEAVREVALAVQNEYFAGLDGGPCDCGGCKAIRAELDKYLEVKHES